MAYTTMQTLKEDIVKALRARVPILPFHARFLRAAYSPGVDVAALSCPRGSGKTWLLGQLAALALTPGSPTWESGIEVIAVSGSLEQSRVMLQFVRQAVSEREDEYRLLDSSQRLSIDASVIRDKVAGAFIQREASDGVEPIFCHLCG